MRFLFFAKNRVLHLSSPRPLYEARFDDTLRNNHYLTTYCGIDDLVNSHVGEIILGHHLFISVKFVHICHFPFFFLTITTFANH
jgi:hypothetical protein